MPTRAGRRARLETETMAVPACCVPCSVQKRNIMPARQSGSPRQQCSGAISAFVDSTDSHIILRIIHESITRHTYGWMESQMNGTK